MRATCRRTRTRAAILKEDYEAFGRADILIANAGGPPPGTFDAVSTEEALHRGWELTFMSAVRMIRGVLGGMRERKWGRIVAITSVSVHEPIPGLALSNAYRPGLTGLLKTIATEVAADGVTVNSVCPGYTATERLDGAGRIGGGEGVQDPRRNRSRVVRLHPRRPPRNTRRDRRRRGLPCSEPASYITGVALPVDGGRLKGLLA